MGRDHRTIPARSLPPSLLWLAVVALGCGSPTTLPPGIDLSAADASAGTGTRFDYEAGEAGMVGFTVVADELRLDSVQPHEGWTWRPDLDDTDDDVAIDFHHGSTALKVDFEADIHNGVLVVEVETSSPADDRTLEWAADTAANVQIVVNDQRVSLERITAQDGWTWTQRDRDAVSIEFVNGQGDLVEFDARTDDGRLEVEVETRSRPILDDALE